MKRRFRPFMLCAALVLSLQGARAADIYGYVDSKGIAHFASEKIDERYQIFFRGGQSFDTANGISPLGRGVGKLDGKVSPASQSLLAMFEASPGYKTAKAALRDASSKHDIDYELLQALIATESGFDAQAVSPKGAMGLMQLMPATAQRYGVSADKRSTIEKKLFDPRINIAAGSRYLRDLIAMFPGQIELAIAAYNAGEGAVQRAGTKIPNYKETQNYVQTVLQLYAARLVAEGLLTEGEVEKMKADWRAHLEQEFEAGQHYKPNKADWLDGEWSGLRAADNADEQRRGKTAVPMKTLKEIGRKLSEIPAGFHAHRTIQRFMENRANMVQTGEGIDWAMAEALAFGSLVVEGHKIRLSGQDCERGTFSQRHSVLYDQETEERYIPLANLSPTQARYEVINSMLSEEAVLGFEYGYSLARPNALTLWEAQFGDFANGAQVVFDQFISSGERKWLRMSGLVCLLPHGYEGQGPEHSSARLERYLQLCAEDNMQVANVTTPANYFHILRRQLKRDFRKPLILMTPKSLLRHKRAVSSLAEMAGETSFHRLLWDDAEVIKDGPIKLQKDNKIRRVVICSGKVYYDLLEEREKRGIDDIYLLRIEQLYPFPAKALINELSRFRNAEMVWCQEEPKNMGAWSFIDPYLEWVLAHIDAKYQRVRYTGRPAAASPATGLMSKHLTQLAAFLEDALGG